MIDEGEYILPGLTRPLYLQLLRSASKERGYTDAEVRVSLLLDVDKSREAGDGINSIRGYSRIWGWSHKKVRLQWESIWQDVARIASSNGRQLHGHKRTPFADKLPAEWEAWLHAEYPAPDADLPETGGAHEGHTRGTSRGTEIKPNDAEKSDQGHTRGTARAHEGHTTNHPTSYILSGGVSSAGARPGGTCFENPAVALYARVVGKWPAILHAEKIARRFANPPEDTLTLWGEHVTTYHVSNSRNADNIPGIIQTFDEHISRTAAGLDSPHGGGGGGAVGSQSVTPSPSGRTPRGRTGGPDHVRGTAAERASLVTVSGLLDGLEKHRREREERGDGDPLGF